MANNVNIPAQGTGDTTPKVSTDQVSADSSQVQNFQQVSVSGGVLTRNPTIPVSAASLPLPAGASTETTLAAANTAIGTTADAASSTTGTVIAHLRKIRDVLVAGIPALVSGRVPVDGSGVTQPVSAASLPLPSGAATESTLGLIQVSGGTAIGSLKGQVVDATATASAPTYTEGTVNPLSQTLSGALRVGGTVTANVGTTNGLALDATLTGGTAKTKLVDTGGTNVATVSAGGALKVDGSAVTQPVSGTIAVSGTMPISVAVGQQVDGHSANIGALADAASASTLTGLLKNLKAALAGTLTVSGTVTTTPPSNASSNVAQINGVTPLMGAGNTGTGSLRVTVASDQVAVPTKPGASTAVAQTTVACSASSVTLLSLNAAALNRTIVNDSTSAGYLRFNASAATNANFTIKLAAGQTYEFPNVLYTGEIRAISDTATGNWRVSEWT